jgi:hypothetical protein
MKFHPFRLSPFGPKGKRGGIGSTKNGESVLLSLNGKPDYQGMFCLVCHREFVWRGFYWLIFAGTWWIEAKNMLLFSTSQSTVSQKKIGQKGKGAI